MVRHIHTYIHNMRWSEYELFLRRSDKAPASMSSFITSDNHHTPSSSLSSAPSRDGQGVETPSLMNAIQNTRLPRKWRKLNFIGALVITLEEMNCTLRARLRVARICVYVRFILWCRQSSTADETDQGDNGQVLMRETQTSNSHVTTPPTV